MRTLSKIIVSVSLVSMLSACYVEPRHHYYYSHRDCYGYHCYRR